MAHTLPQLKLNMHSKKVKGTPLTKTHITLTKPYAPFKKNKKNYLFNHDEYVCKKLFNVMDNEYLLSDM